MKKSEMLKRIEALEAQVRLLSALVTELQSRQIYVTPTSPWTSPNTTPHVPPIGPLVTWCSSAHSHSFSA